jgi:uncharacterized RDD family membrane protein YckC
MTDTTSDAEAGSPFEQTLEIETPERVRIRYELAGIGSRFAAGTIDAVLLVFVLVALFIVLLLVADVTRSDFEESWRAISIAAYGVALAVVWFFYLGFELLWDGQTPGKRIMRLRVVSDEGGPAPASAIVVRNVLRVADMLPVVIVHLLGGIVMFVNGRSKRLGDLAAGTVVVQEREVTLTLDRLSRGVLDDLHEDQLGGEERARLKGFVARRRELLPAARAKAAERLVADLRARRELPEADAESLVVLLASGRRPSELRDLVGPRRPAEPPSVEPPPEDGAA